jgi:hypothetical protein
METTEEQLAAAAKAPRVSKAEVERAIREGKVTYTVLPNGRTTVCQIELFNERFSVEGSSACVSKENFNQQYGEEASLKEATNEVWGVLGTVLAWKLSLIDAAGPASGAIISLLGSRPLTYVGTKVVRAVPMSLGTYNELRGWTIPENEDPETPGYLVEYTDGGKPNVEGFDGYVSWSPQDVFERAYTVGHEPKPTTFIDRLRAEIDHEQGKFEKLLAFLTTDTFRDLPAADQRDLVVQKSCMEELVWLLRKRLRRAEAKAGK